MQAAQNGPKDAHFATESPSPGLPMRQDRDYISHLVSRGLGASPLNCLRVSMELITYHLLNNHNLSVCMKICVLATQPESHCSFSDLNFNLFYCWREMSLLLFLLI